MRILITGGAGFIGCNFVRMMVNKYPHDEIIVFDNLTYSGRIENLKDIKDKITFIKGDIANPKDLENIGKVDILYNFAAETHVDNSIKDPEPFIKSNILGVYNLLEYVRKYDIDKFVSISTDEVYGSIVEGSFKEDDPLDPSSPYSASKASGDLLCKSYYKTYGAPVIVTRSSNNYGPYHFPEKLIPKMILLAMHDKPLPIYNDGTNIRDWTYVLDNCEAIDLVSKKGKIGEVYNIAANDEWKNIDVVKLILKYLNKPESLINFVEDRPGHDFRYSINTEKIRELGWKPSMDFEEGLKATVEWYINNRWWWEPLVKGF
ncbi:dTDP-glucose 4,6-dehydratase [Methanothermococcus thermolithotrophicus]|uniref:dTDP-glucose 4,6-dehydratase n=1 Tax=Methanothermococcus thermolithotrophicus TaxID=2186 RepID=UPI00037A1FCB|nr:dTDP-glucose 4,6-dehydratase [Methanothermococcus thermolithotrophicus]